jgi:hypothetical protein
LKQVPKASRGYIFCFGDGMFFADPGVEPELSQSAGKGIFRMKGNFFPQRAQDEKC